MLPVQVQNCVADTHQIDPFPLPGVELGGLDAGDGGAEGPVDA